MAEEPRVVLPGSLEPRWTQRRAARARAAIQRRFQRRRAARWIAPTLALALAAGLTVPLVGKQKPAAESSIPKLAAPAPPSPRAALPEPTATPLTADTELVVDPQGAGRAFVLRRGRARFVVPHDERHPFRVRAGALVVEDLGTVFSVARLSEREFEVTVEEGQVAVQCEDSRVELGAKEERLFACGAPDKRATTARPSGASRESLSNRRTLPPRDEAAPNVDLEPAPLQVEPAWRLLAERGQYREAYDSLRRADVAPVRDETHELLLAADTARLSGHSLEAVPYLRRILLQHEDDPRAPLVAFTLGRVLLDELGRPAEAAQAFEGARARPTPLAEDALAREIEAWARAGDAGRAHALALDYQRLYPQGRRSRAVAKFGGIE
jgi:transmembrane sensor